MSAGVYARVAEPLKRALEAQAQARGLSLTRAVCELVERGLERAGEEQSLPERERTLAAAGGELAKTRARLERAELGLQAAREREQLSARTHAAFAARARQELASCPRCRKPLRGCDLLVSGHCPHCDKALSSLPAPTRSGSLVQHEYLALLGALGVLAGLAMAASADSAG